MMIPTTMIIPPDPEDEKVWTTCIKKLTEYGWEIVERRVFYDAGEVFLEARKYTKTGVTYLRSNPIDKHNGRGWRACELLKIIMHMKLDETFDGYMRSFLADNEQKFLVL